MFGPARHQNKQVPVIIPNVGPRAENITVGEAASTYIETADAMRLRSPATETLRLRVALYNLGVKVYDREKVTVYMDKKFPPASYGSSWTWQAMRAEDSMFRLQVEAGVGSMRRAGHIEIEGQVYAQPVPLDVLQLAKRISDAISPAYFYVGAPSERQWLDPFLAVMIPFSELVVIAHWDEPGFERDAQP